jgi:hypothetical protein
MPGEERERHDVAPLESAVRGILRGGRQLTVRQAVELVRGVEDDGEVVRVREQILLERRREHRQPLVEIRELLLLGIVEPAPA